MQDCVLLAAGASSRMGVLKPLLPFAGSTVIETAAGAALSAGCRLVLVTGNRGREVAAPFGSGDYESARAEGRLLVVDNPRWEEGLLGSIQSALPSVMGEAFFLALADMPFIGCAAYRALAAARAAALVERGQAAFAAIASHHGRRGHPVLLPSAWIPEILALDPRGKLRDYLAGKPRVLVETGSGALRDIDTPEDYCFAVSAGI